MSKTIILAENPLAPETWETVEGVEDVCAFLASRFDEFPVHARIYHGSVCEENDITPSDEAGIEKLKTLGGVFHIVVYPSDPVSIIAVIAIAVIAAVAINQLVPDPQTFTSEVLARKQDNSSPNNELSKRENRARINGRIPDIFGTVRSVPDLVAPPYTEYQDNLEVEHALMCIGKGSYEIPEGGIREGETGVSEIPSHTVEIYGSGVNPSVVNIPEVIVGDPIQGEFLSTVRHSAVYGQTLFPASGNQLVGDGDLGFAAAERTLGGRFGYINTPAGSGIDFRNFIALGSNLRITDVPHQIDVLDDTAPPVARGCTLSYEIFPGFTQVVIDFDDGFTHVGVGAVTGLNFTADGEEYNLDGVYNFYTETGDTYFFEFEEILRYINPNWGIFLAAFAEHETVVFSGSAINVATTPQTIDVSGDYVVSGVTDRTISIFTFPDNVADDWAKISRSARPDEASNPGGLRSPTLDDLSGEVLGPYFLDDPETSDILINVQAPQGLYSDDGTAQAAIFVELEATITPVDKDKNPIGGPFTVTKTLDGSSTSKNKRSRSINIGVFPASRCTVSLRRTTDYVTGFEGQVVEEVVWLDLYGAKKIAGLDFGDVTLARTRESSTTNVSRRGGRELSMSVTRKIPRRISGSDFTTELFPTSRADEIISFIALDPYIGNRAKDELDFDSIFNTVQEIENYFGSTAPAEFNYTFDSDNLSFEEAVSAICKAIFCTAYRRGSQIKISFEGETENSTLLFNHRNKIPGTETRTVRFGNRNENDGVEFDYVDPADDSIETLYIPGPDAINPQKVDMPGIRSKLQAHFHANRVWNKIQHQHISAEFRATQEADLLVLGDRVLIADNTRPDIQDGEVLHQHGLELTLSQKVDLSEGSGHVIFLQSPDGTIESIGVAVGSDQYRVVLASAPNLALSLDPNNYARTTYLIVGSEDTAANAFLVTEKQPGADFTSALSAINYDSRYYDNDTDFKNGIVDSDGNPN